MKKITNNELVQFLKNQSVNASFVDKLKIVYRPYICPFDDLLQTINKSDKIMDIGCGSGQFAMLIAEFSDASMISGVEIDSKLICNANTLLKPYQDKIDINFTKYDGINFPKGIGGVERVFMIDVLHHVPKNLQLSFLKNLYENMKVGSTLVLKDIDAKSPFVYFNKLHDLVFSQEIGNEMKSSDLEGFLEKIGFKIISSSKRRMFVYAHFTLIVQK